MQIGCQLERERCGPTHKRWQRGARGRRAGDAAATATGVVGALFVHTRDNVVLVVKALPQAHVIEQIPWGGREGGGISGWEVLRVSHCSNL